MFSRYLMKNMLGYDDILMNSIKTVADAENNSGIYFIQAFHIVVASKTFYCAQTDIAKWEKMYLILTLLFITLKNGQISFQNVSVFTMQDFKSIFGHFCKYT